MNRRTVLAACAIAAACSPPSPPPSAAKVVEITGTDYAFQAPTSIPAGPTEFRFVNKGKVRHELSVARLKSGVSIDQFVSTVRKGETVRSLIEGPVGVIFAEPGESSYSLLRTDAKPGSTLAVICIFRDSAKAPQHADMGMYAAIGVANDGSDARLANVVADTIVGSDYAFQYPRELVEGRHTIVFRNEGKQRHEVNIELLAKGVTLARLLAAEKAGENMDSLFDKSVGVLHVYGGESPLGQLTFDVLPGREYLVACYFKNDDKSPEHYSMGMFGSIKGVPKQTKS